MDTFRNCVLIVTFIAFVCIQNNPEAAMNDNCTDTDGCFSPNETCESGMCTCNSGYFEKDDSCQQKMSLGSNCSSDQQCVTPSASCSSLTYMCTCYEDFYENGNGSCIPKVILGGHCSTDDQCLTNYTACVNNETCTCYDDYYEKGNTCVPKMFLGENCSSHDQCWTNNTSCVSNQTCTCNDDYYEKGNICVHRGHCSTDDQCLTNYTACVNNETCTCNDDYYEKGNTCVPKLDYAVTCAPDSQCRSELRCVNTGTESKCLCPNNTFYKDSDGGCEAKLDYAVTCTSDNQCRSEFKCVNTGTESKCLCLNNTFYKDSNGSCEATSTLKPTINANPSSTHNSVTLTWTSPNATGYTNSYIVKYSIASGDEQTHNVTGDVTTTTVSGLSSGTDYTMFLVRSISRHGRTQSVEQFGPIQIITKLDYASQCTNRNQCRSDLDCVSTDSGRKCLCPDNNYFRDTPGRCESTSGLAPVISHVLFETDRATVNWTSSFAMRYSDNYKIKYGGTDTGSLGNVLTATITGLTPGATYSFVVSRSISREGRTQHGIDSQSSGGATEKIEYDQPCSTNGTCKDTNTNCYSSICKCDPQWFRNTQTNMCQHSNVLIPQNVGTQRESTTSIRVTWTAPTYTAVVVGYEVDVTPNVPNISTDINGTTAMLSSLTPGQQYSITVKTKVSYFNRDERAEAQPEKETAIPAQTTGLSDNTTLNAPNITISFSKAEGVADSYTVRVYRGDPEPYDKQHNTSNTGDTIHSQFTGVTAGQVYTITITTISNGVLSQPFTATKRVKVQQAGQVTELNTSTITSRSIFISWKKPTHPNGQIHQYRLRALNDTVCTEQIIFNCSECNQVTIPVSIKLNNLNIETMNDTSESPCNSQPVIIQVSNTDIGSSSYVINHNITNLLPDTTYTLKVAAFNEQGEGMMKTVNGRTAQEAAGQPLNFHSPNHMADTIELKWDPPRPRPGGTGYNITVLERKEDSSDFVVLEEIQIAGYYENSAAVTGLSSYWDYRFKIKAYTSEGGSGYSEMQNSIKTSESAPREVESLQASYIDDVYDQLELSWKCPKQKDGRNGVIQFGVVEYSTGTQHANVNPVTGVRVFPNYNNKCHWTEKINVTAEFNYTFEVYIKNTMEGNRTSVVRYMRAGPATVQIGSISVPKGTPESLSEKMIKLSVCPTCVLNGKNGRITSSGIIICKEPCQAAKRRRRNTLTEEEYDNMANWHEAKTKEFNGEYRTTPKNWLADSSSKSGIEYQIGSDTTCEQKDGTTFCNGPLPAGTKFQIVVFACTSAGCNRGDKVTVSTKEPETNLGLIIGAVAGVVGAIIVIVIVVLVVRYIRRKNRYKQAEHISIGAEEELIVKKRPVSINHIEKKVEEMHKDSNLLFSEEFEDLNSLSPKHQCVASETGGNKLKNRYVNILPFDHSRVKLLPTEEDDEETDYINANYIPGYRSLREYIATQGPMTGTVNDFWRMIWEQNVPIIVMLSDLMEKGKPKVDRYYPENMEPVQYGDIIVEMTNFSPLSKYVIRIFKLQLGDEVRTVRHYFLPGWQDFGANLTSDDVINFLKSVRMEIKPNTQGPICVHCSAGVGRTGTYIALDVFQQHIDEENMEKDIDIFDFSLKMRQNRAYMIQTEKQYIFVHDTIKEMIIRKKKEMAERDHIYQNHTPDENVYENQAFEADTQDIYMNVDPTSGKPTTVL